MQRRVLANGASKPAPAPPAGDVTHLRAAAPLVDVPPSVILLTLCHVESTSDSVGHAQALQDEATSTGESGCASFSR